MSIRLIFFPFVSNYCHVMQLKEMKCTKSVCLFCHHWNIYFIIFFFFFVVIILTMICPRFTEWVKFDLSESHFMIIDFMIIFIIEKGK